MRPKFMNELTIISSGTALDACGPTDWLVGKDESADVHVIVQQGSVVARGKSPPSFDPAKDPNMWALKANVVGAKKLVAGPAVAAAIAVIQKDTGFEVFHWEQDVKLKV